MPEHFVPAFVYQIIRQMQWFRLESLAVAAGVKIKKG